MWCYINYPVPKENCQLALINTSYKGNKGAYDNAKSNARDTILFTIFFTNCWCGEWLLVNEKNDINGGPR